MNRNIDPNLIRQINQNNPEVSQTKYTYVNEYGDIIPPNDPTLLKCQRIIEQRLGRR